MNYILTSFISSVYRFIAIDEKFITLNLVEKFISIKKENKPDLVIEVESLGDIKLLNQEALIFKSNDNGSITIIDIDNGEKIYSNAELTFRLEIFKNLIVNAQYNRTTFKVEYGVFDWQQKRLLWRNIKYSFLKFFDEKLFSTESNDLFRVDVTSGLALWNKSFEKKIAQPIGVYKNQLILSLKDQILIGLDVETGDLLWEAQIPKEIRVDISRNAHLDLQADKIYFLTSIAFMEFDIQTAKVSRTKSFWTGDFQTSWQFGHSCKQDDYLYFTAGIGTAQFYYWLGVFHIPTMEIVWKYQREDRKETFNSTPQVNGNKLFALDSGGTLHIFERD